MSVEYLIAFGGPLMVGVLALVAAMLVNRPAAQSRAGGDLASSLADAESAARRLANDIARARERLAGG